MQIPAIASEFIANGGFPVKYLSYSSIKQYLQDPRGFLKKYIRYEFDDTTSPSYMAGLSVHKALELYFSKMIETGEILDKADVIEFAFEHLDRLLHEKAGKAYSKELDKFGITFAFPNFTKEVTDAEIRKLRQDSEARLREYYTSGELLDETGASVILEEDALDALMIEIGNSLIKWGASDLDEVKTWIAFAVDNYFDNEPAYGTPFATERFETVVFQDEDGRDMPIPIKVGVDRVDLIDDGKACQIIDYKTIDKFTEDEAEKTEYELQAVACYFAALVMTGVKPKRMVYVEILKSHPGYEYTKDPDNKLLKANLIEIAAIHGVEFEPKELVEGMKQKLVDAGVFTKKKGVNEYVIDFDERYDAIAFFLAIYKGVVTMIALSELCGVYLPNIFERFGGLESARDFKEFEAIPRPVVIKQLAEAIPDTLSPEDSQKIMAGEEIDTF